MLEVNFPNAVRDEKDFYGRKEELERVAGIFLSGSRIPVVIFGERRVGKTSFQNIILQRLRAAERISFAPLVLEPRGLDSFREFARAVILCLLSQAGAVPGLPAMQRYALPEVDTIHQFETEFRARLAPSSQQVYLLCIDEFDEIVRKMPESELPRILGLIHYLIERTELPVRLFFTMTHLPEALQKEVPSALITKSQPVDLAPFTRAELGSAVEGILKWPAELADNELEWLFKLSGGNPYFLKLLLVHILSKNPTGGASLPWTEELKEWALAEALQDARANHVLENLYYVHFNDFEREILLLLAQDEQRLTLGTLQPAGSEYLTAARRLVKRYYLEQDQALLDFRIGFLGRWLQKWDKYEEELDRLTGLRSRLAEPQEIEIDSKTGQVRVMNRPVKLSVQEVRILQYLAERAGQLVGRENLIQAVWETTEGVSDQTVDTAFYRLRKKIGDQGQYIETIPGQGFVLRRAILIPFESR